MMPSLPGDWNSAEAVQQKRAAFGAEAAIAGTERSRL